MSYVNIKKDDLKKMLDEIVDLKSKLETLIEDEDDYEQDVDREVGFPSNKDLIGRIEYLEDYGALPTGTADQYSRDIIKALKDEYNKRQALGINRATVYTVTDSDIQAVFNKLFMGRQSGYNYNL